MRVGREIFLVGFLFKLVGFLFKPVGFLFWGGRSRVAGIGKKGVSVL